MDFLFCVQLTHALREQEAPDEHTEVCSAWTPEQHLKLEYYWHCLKIHTFTGAFYCQATQ